MGNLIQVNDLSYAVGGNRLFGDLSVAVGSKDRIGLVGHNGCGKSTLLAILAGRTEADRGQIQKLRGLRVMEVEQFLPDGLADIALVDAVGAEHWRAEALLTALGFAESSYAIPVGQLSGGQQNRLMFARAAVDEPDLLLLDEPTNHLDLATLVVFEKFLAQQKSAFVLVSHDRAFLDAVTDRTWVLRDGRIYNYALSYSRARTQLEEHDEASQHARSQEEKKIEALRASAARLNLWGKVYDNEKLAKRGKAIDRRADRLEENKTFVTSGSPLSLSLDSTLR